MAKDIVQLAVDIHNGTTGEFSKEQANEALRQKLVEIAGSDKLDYKAMRKNKAEFFQIIEEALDLIIGNTVEEQFGELVDVRNTAWGDTIKFEVQDYHLFNVATIAEGNGNMRRQRLDHGWLSVDTQWKAVKVYDELIRFLAGRVDWTSVVNKVGKSYNHQIAVDMYKAIYDSFDVLGATYRATGTFSETALDGIIENVEAHTGLTATVMGTKLALGKILPSAGYLSYNMMDARNHLGYIGEYKGTRMVELKQAHVPGTDALAINDSFLTIVPTGGEKIVKLVIEGDALVQESSNENSDMSMEYTFMKKAGIATISPARYGIYRLA